MSLKNPRRNSRKSAKKLKVSRTFYLGILTALVVPAVISALWSVQMVSGAAQRISQTQVPSELYSQYGMSLLSAAIAVAASCIGAGIAIYGAASAGSAAMAERPETSIWIVILAGLGEGVAIYGLLIAILILGKLPSFA